MSYLETLNSHNTQIQNLINKANSLPEAGSGGGGSIDTCTVIINCTAASSGWKYSCTAYENNQFVIKCSDFYDGVSSSVITLTNVVCGSTITCIGTGATHPFSTLDDATMQWGGFMGGDCCFSAPLTAGVTATATLNPYD